MGSQQFCLRWNNHQANLLSVFDKLLLQEAFVDVTIACEGTSIKAHKMILSACSPFFEDIFAENPCKHPIVIIKDMKFTDLKAIVDFMYKGEVNVSQDKLAGLLRTAEALKIKGLTEMIGDQSFDLNDLDHHKTLAMSNPRTYSTNQPIPSIPIIRQSAKKRRRKNSGENKPIIPNKSEVVENSTKCAKTESMEGDNSVRQGMHKENNEVNPNSVENNSEPNNLLDPSSFMQQSLTENQAFDVSGKTNKDLNRPQGSDDQAGANSNSSSLSSLSASDKMVNLKVVKQEKMDKDFYVEDITHILPQSKQDLMVRGVTMVPMTSQPNSTSTPISVDNSDNCDTSPSRDAADSFSNQTADILPHPTTGAIITADNFEGIAGPSVTEHGSPGRSSATGARFHASVVSNILIRVSGTVCPFCYKNFSSKMSLVRHVRCIHTDPDSIQKHECHLCGKSYIRKDKLHDHLSSAHQVISPGKLQSSQQNLSTSIKRESADQSPVHLLPQGNDRP